MTDTGDKEIIQMADDIRNKQASDKREIHENFVKNWHESKLGHYYQESFTGAHDEAFKVFYCRRIEWSYVETLEVMFAHLGHYSMGKNSLSHSEHEEYRFREEFYTEIDEITFLGYVNKFLKLTGLKEKMDKETNH